METEMLRKLLALFALLLPPMALSYDATVSWSNPTKNDDGTDIPASGPGSLTGIKIEHGSCVGALFGTKAGEVIVPPTPATTTVTGFAAAQTVCFRAAAINTYGAQSAFSLVATKTMPTPVPNPPVLSATVTVAYEAIQKGRSLVIGRVVGNVALGAPCVDREVATTTGVFYTVEPGYVVLTRAPKGVVVTKCAWI
jgi:hypothetical protein